MVEPVDDPAYLRLANELVGDIRSGALALGTRLPGTRSLARSRGVSRNTVIAAFNELRVQGWITTHAARGSFVRAELPREERPHAPLHSPPERPGYRLAGAAPAGPAFGQTPRGLINLSAGIPDPRLIPADLIARAYRRVLKRRGASLLGYGDPRGESELRSAMAGLLSKNRGYGVSADNVLITRGAQMGISLVAELLLRPQDRVAVERYGYRPAWEALERRGAVLDPIPVDADGIDVEALIRRDPPRALYLTPHHQFPTMALLSAERRRKLLTWATRHRVAVIEDDYDHEFQFQGRPVPPLAADDPKGVVLYVGGLSKVLAPALRMGFIAAPAMVIERAARLRLSWDRQGERVLEAALAELFQLDEIQRHIRKMKRVYEERRAALAEALRSQLSEVLRFRLPPGGLSLWAEVIDGTPLGAWQEETRRRGVLFAVARDFDLRGREAPFLRLAFSALNAQELEDAVRVLRRAHRAVGRAQ